MTKFDWGKANRPNPDPGRVSDVSREPTRPEKKFVPEREKAQRRKEDRERAKAQKREDALKAEYKMVQWLRARRDRGEPLDSAERELLCRWDRKR